MEAAFRRVGDLNKPPPNLFTSRELYTLGWVQLIPRGVNLLIVAVFF